MKPNIDQVQEFVKKSFQENQSYSFGDWAIMYQHSLEVKEIALRIAESIPCDKELLAVEALLHDIGKTFKASPEILREHHAELGFEVAKAFLPKLGLPEEQAKKLETFLRGEVETSVEGRIVKDADIIAFFSNAHLQQVFKIWADGEGLKNELQRKADKMQKLNFDVSRVIAKPLYEKMRDRWGLV